MAETLEQLLPMLCPVSSQPAQGTCFAAGTLVWTHHGTVPIEQLRLGDRVLTFTMDEAGRFAVDVVEVDPATWKRLRLRVEHDDGFWIDVELLRSPEWIAQHVSDDGRHVWLDMPEMGVVGIARVGAIEPCPPIAEGPGRVVTSTFKHRLGTVYDLRVAGEEKAIGTTPTHPFWSVDREQWIPAVELQPGERLKTWTGFSTVESIEPRPEPEPVYNIEVEGDHVYRVGESGVLVHNNSVPSPMYITSAHPRFDRYVRGSARYRGRQPSTSWLFLGGRNLGAVRYKNQNGNTVTNTTALDHFVSMGTSMHTEARIIGFLQNLPSFGEPGSMIRVYEIFTERAPCMSCLANLAIVSAINCGVMYDILVISDYVTDDQTHTSAGRLKMAYTNLGIIGTNLNQGPTFPWPS